MVGVGLRMLFPNSLGKDLVVMVLCYSVMLTNHENINFVTYHVDMHFVLIYQLF